MRTISIKNDYWLSRRPRYTGDELFAKAQHHLLNIALLAALRLLRLAVAQNHAEAKWLLNYLLARRIEDGQPSRFISVNHWVRWIFSDSQNSRILPYHLYFSDLKDPADLCSAIKLAKAGDGMAQFILGRHYEASYDDVRAELWYQKAVDQNYPSAFYALACCCIPKKNQELDNDPRYVDLIIKGARLDDKHAMDMVLDIYTGRNYRNYPDQPREITELELLRISTAAGIEKTFGRREIARRLQLNFNNLHDMVNMQVNLNSIFTVGQFLADTEDIYPHRKADNEYNQTIARAVYVYQQMTSKARQAAVYAILVLRCNKLVVRDVAILIAKLVYASRMDVEWYIDRS